MNLYLLVEGKSEKKLYKDWLKVLTPGLRMIGQRDEIGDDSYRIVNAGGQPGIFSRHIPQAVETVDADGSYDYLIVALDAEEQSVDETAALVVEAAKDLQSAKLFVIVQNRCIESWLLGNRAMFKRTPQDATLRGYIEFYNVMHDDPEAMPSFRGFNTAARFHKDYLRRIFKERGSAYTEKFPEMPARRPILKN